MGDRVTLRGQLGHPLNALPVVPHGPPVIRTLLNDPAEEPGPDQRRTPHLTAEVRTPQWSAVPGSEDERTRVRPFIGHSQEAVRAQLVNQERRQRLLLLRRGVRWG